MLAAAHRLRRRQEFAAAVRGGRRAGRGAVVVHLTVPDASETDRSLTRAGFVVSRAIGGAVVRNLVRRRLRHLIAERIDALPPGTTLVVRALPSAADRSYARLAADLDAALAAARAPRDPAGPVLGQPVQGGAR
ncbi:MAG TPA: ribonuclease P protein component [Pilimelia sp.]|nr:ribonuclease P protein component [Pilimelia sp.]